jgi:hypothetical protein
MLRSRPLARSTRWKSVPGADLLLSNVYDALMPDVVDVKDLGSGVIDGKECNHLAFRTKELDWQIWIAEGDRLYPCRYVITISANPQPEARRYGKAVTVGPPSGVTLPCYP